MSRASEDTIDAIHDLQATVLRDYLVRVKENPEEISPAMMAQVNKFLKDNGVDRPHKDGDGVDLLALELDEFESRSNVTPLHK